MPPLQHGQGGPPPPRLQDRIPNARRHVVISFQASAHLNSNITRAVLTMLHRVAQPDSIEVCST